MFHIRISLLLIPLFLMPVISGCGPSTVKKAEQVDDSKQLDSKQIFTLLNGNTVHLVSSNFDAHVFLDENGLISAKALYDDYNTDGGKWNITDDNTLCLFFTVWFYGDLNCYSVFNDPRERKYQMFNDSGVLAFTATVSPGDSESLAVPKPAKNEKFIRRNLERKGQE